MISRLYVQFSRNDSAMSPECMAVRKNFRLLEYEHIIYHFKAHNLEISFYKLFREICKFSENMSKNKFREIT